MYVHIAALPHGRGFTIVESTCMLRGPLYGATIPYGALPRFS